MYVYILSLDVVSVRTDVYGFLGVSGRVYSSAHLRVFTYLLWFFSMLGTFSLVDL